MCFDPSAPPALLPDTVSNLILSTRSPHPPLNSKVKRSLGGAGGGGAGGGGSRMLAMLAAWCALGNLFPGGAFPSLRAPASSSSSRSRRGAPSMAPRDFPGLPGHHVYRERGAVMNVPGGGGEINACLWNAIVGAGGHVGALGIAPFNLRVAVVDVMREHALLDPFFVPGALRGYERDLGLPRNFFADRAAYVDYIAAGNVMGGHPEILGAAIVLDRPVYLFYDHDLARADRLGDDFLRVGHGPPLLIAHVNGNHFVQVAAGAAPAVVAGAGGEMAEVEEGEGEGEEAELEPACKCGAPDSTRMIQCNACEEWQHYHCASVTNATVPSGPWNCGCASASKKRSVGAPRPAAAPSGVGGRVSCPALCFVENAPICALEHALACAHRRPLSAAAPALSARTSQAHAPAPTANALRMRAVSFVVAYLAGLCMSAHAHVCSPLACCRAAFSLTAPRSFRALNLRRRARRRRRMSTGRASTPWLQ
jgi:hypothetical protein